MNVWAKFSLKFDEFLIKNLSQFACLYLKINLNFKPFVAFFKPYKKIKKRSKPCLIASKFAKIYATTDFIFLSD